MSLSPYKRYFANLIDTSVEIEYLKEFILHMDDSLDEDAVNCTCNKETTAQPLDIIREDRDYLLNIHFPKLLHSGFIISVMSFLEQRLDLFCKDLRVTGNHGLTLHDLSGSFLDKFRNYCLHVAQLPIANGDWNDIRCATEVRNCLVHHAGMLDGFGKADQIRAFVRRHHTPAIDRNNALVVTRKTSLCILDIVHSFIESIHKAALLKYPDHKACSSQSATVASVEGKL